MPSSFYRRHHHHQHHYHHHSHLFYFIDIFIIVFIIKFVFIKIIRRPAGVSCGSCLFVGVLSVLSFVILSLSRLSPWRGFLPHPPVFFVFVVIVLFVLFVFIFCHDVLGSAHDSLNTRLVLNMLLSFPLFFPLFLLSLCLPPVFCVVSNVRYFI